jgi:hypothetical protein
LARTRCRLIAHRDHSTTQAAVGFQEA